VSKRLALAVLLLASLSAVAEDMYIAASALFEGRAMLSINGRTQLLRVGQQSPEGVKLVAANAKSAVIEFQGKRQTLSPGRAVSGGFAPVERRSAAIHRSDHNEYFAIGSVNGLPVQFLIDTGANVVAFSGTEARRLGIDYRLKGSPSHVRTASGVTQSWSIVLDRVELAGIVVHHVQASVIEGNYPEHALLGMSFLGHTAMRNDNGVLYIEER
jgi:aspartyl protease family protein